MSKRKSERLVNLLILLLSTQHFVSKRQIRETIEGYRDMGDEAFNRMFERDKEELRSIGAPIVTGTNDPDSDETDGYRINRSEFELPAISFTAEERAVLGVATQVWQESVAATETADALETLRAAGADPDPDRARTLRARVPVEPGFDAVRVALTDRREVQFGYRGQPRRVQPWRLSQRRGRWYLLGLDLDRSAPRHFKLSRFTSEPQLVGGKNAYQTPPAAELAAVAELETQRDDATVLLAVRVGRGGDLRRRAVAAQWDGEVPAGFEVLSLHTGWLEGLVSDVCALADDALLLAPPEVRELVVARLRHVAGRWS